MALKQKTCTFFVVYKGCLLGLCQIEDRVLFSHTTSSYQGKKTNNYYFDHFKKQMPISKLKGFSQRHMQRLLRYGKSPSDPRSIGALCQIYYHFLQRALILQSRPWAKRNQTADNQVLTYNPNSISNKFKVINQMQQL